LLRVLTGQNKPAFLLAPSGAGGAVLFALERIIYPQMFPGVFAQLSAMKIFAGSGTNVLRRGPP
jgi:hypothetical protein